MSRQSKPPTRIERLRLLEAAERALGKASMGFKESKGWPIIHHCYRQLRRENAFLRTLWGFQPPSKRKAK